MDFREFEKTGYSIVGNSVSWAKPVEKEVVKESEPRTQSESKQ